MSKKKAFSGSTMTLKDFHGGSIPSDLPLPSAPGTSSLKPPDRWAPPKIRPGSAPSANPERGPPFLPTSANIGRNYFEEDERKPFDSSLNSFQQQRRPLSDPVVSRSDPKPQVRQGGVGPTNNAWGPRKEVNFVEDLSSRFAQASAIDKVTSGRWQSKMSGNVGDIRVSERPKSNEERPKLNLLPRTQVNESSGNFIDEKQGHVPAIDPRPVHLEIPREPPTVTNMPRPGSTGEDVGGHANERPKLNLKPRSLPVEQSDESIEKERKSLFGGARPRELVLKERGIDDIIATTVEVTSPANRIITDTAKIDTKPNNLGPLKKDFRSDNEKVDNILRASWRNNNWKNPREIEKRPEQQPEPDTWRKPIDPPKPEVPARPGKAVSPLELAQAFSRPSSDVQADRVHVPFSRLTDTRKLHPGLGSRRINGY